MDLDVQDRPRWTWTNPDRPGKTQTDLDGSEWTRRDRDGPGQTLTQKTWTNTRTDQDGPGQISFAVLSNM